MVQASLTVNEAKAKYVFKFQILLWNSLESKWYPKKKANNSPMKQQPPNGSPLFTTFSQESEGIHAEYVQHWRSPISYNWYLRGLRHFCKVCTRVITQLISVKNCNGVVLLAHYFFVIPFRFWLVLIFAVACLVTTYVFVLHCFLHWSVSRGGLTYNRTFRDFSLSFLSPSGSRHHLSSKRIFLCS